MQEADRQISEVEMRRTFTIALGGSQPVASQALVMHFFQLLVRLVLPGGKQKGQVQKIKLLVAAPTQALTQKVSNQMKRTQCPQQRPTETCYQDCLASIQRPLQLLGAFLPREPFGEVGCREAVHQGK